MHKTPSAKQTKENQDISTLVSIVIYIISMLFVFAISWFMFSALIPKGSLFNKVDGTSMEPTLQDGQIVFTDMTDLTYGDIVTACFPASAVESNPDREEMFLIKRVMGLPGDTIRITTEGIYVNEQLLKEEYLPEENRQYTYIQGRQQEFVLAEGEYFIVGDNREISYDSRSFGPVKNTDILYKQSEKPTVNFAVKVAIVLIMVLVDIILFSVIERILTKCVRRFIKR